jgi:hypothetical protein
VQVNYRLCSRPVLVSHALNFLDLQGVQAVDRFVRLGGKLGVERAEGGNGASGRIDLSLGNGMFSETNPIEGSVSDDGAWVV